MEVFPVSNIQLAINLRRLRLDHNYTQQQLGKMLNLSRQAYSNYETGKRIPDIDLLIRIADIYGVKLEQPSTQTCTGNGVVNETAGPYLTGKLQDGNDSSYLTAEEVMLLTKYRNSGENERLVIRKVLDL